MTNQMSLCIISKVCMGEMRMLIDLTDVLQTEGKTWETTASIDMDAKLYIYLRSPELYLT